MHRIDTTTAHTSVREAFANCIIHCAYTVMGNITVDRYFNRIVLSNPGTMLVSKEESILVNQDSYVGNAPLFDDFYVWKCLGFW